MNRVAGKVALVTGAAMGIGRACAGLLAAEAASVFLTDLDRDQGEQAARELCGSGRNARFLPHDVSSESDWDRVMQAVVSQCGRLDILVNNAGIGVTGDVEHTTLESWHRVLRVNLDGVFLGTRAGVQAMRATGNGSIVNISSIEGLIGDPDLAAYNASKGAVRLLTKSAALYCAREKLAIRVNSVHPGYIKTPMVENAMRAAPDPDGMRRHLESLHPVGHLGEPDDVAYGVLYLASDEAKFVTGSELVIDGGYTAQ
ncbi:MAG TPA: SDR family oxidoreductase [Gemmatimonadales bacterium]|nr:SDR family oxidoreductase [Gemmatimonadales bacterium]